MIDYFNPKAVPVYMGESVLGTPVHIATAGTLIKGDKGDPGEKGDKGDSYILTPEDKEEIAHDAVELVRPLKEAAESANAEAKQAKTDSVNAANNSKESERIVNVYKESAVEASAKAQQSNIYAFENAEKAKQNSVDAHAAAELANTYSQNARESASVASACADASRLAQTATEDAKRETLQYVVRAEGAIERAENTLINTNTAISYAQESARRAEVAADRSETAAGQAVDVKEDADRAKTYAESAQAAAESAAASASESKQNYTEIAGQVTELNETTATLSELIHEIQKYNCIDIINQYKVVDATKGGITTTVNDDGSVHLQGTSTAQVFFNYFYDMSNLANGLVNGKTYTLIHASEKVRVEIWFYKNGSYLKGSSYRQNVNITIPSDANGMLIRLRVDSGLTVNEDVRPMMLNTLSNQEIVDKIGDIISDKAYLKYKGSLANDFNIDGDFDTGLYLLTGNTSAPTDIGNLFNIRNSNTIRTQIIYKFTGLNIYYRRFASGTWSNWENIKYNFGELYPLRQKKYLAFGDSLTWGALWNDTTPTITQATVGSRIPDRIANAVNCKEYVNYGVGGMGFVQTSDANPDTIIDHMKKQNISNADLITVMAGRNDGNIQLGTKDSAEADGTICGALKEVINYIRMQNKTCQIVIIQTTPNTTANNPFGARSNSGWTLNDVDSEFSAICKTMNVGYASWYGCSLLSRWSDLSGGGGNYSHMRTDEGYEQMGDFIAGQVCKFYHN